MNKTAIQKLISRCETLISIPMNDSTELGLAALTISDVLEDAKKELAYYPYTSQAAKDLTEISIDEWHI